MVLLTITPLMVEALGKLQTIKTPQDDTHNETEKPTKEAVELESSEDRNNEEPAAESCEKEHNFKHTSHANEPSLSNPKIGNPISHSQVINLWKELAAQVNSSSTYALEALLHGSNIYIPPPPPKPEPTPEYKALMARLRADEEARTYIKMTTSTSTTSLFPPIQPLPHPAFSSPIPPTDLGDSDIIHADINRQLTVILNILISIVCCAAAIWIAARWWSTPVRLALSMSGSVVVGVAEVVVYGGYLRRVGEAREKERGRREVREVVGRWVVGGDGDDGGVDVVERRDGDGGGGLRKRNVSKML
ncbi:endoplasmic reticulum-based factor for assembly of V-ATPase-domain-containing protein [Xylogone sp. PMI_703]|nr:endoplasmic reticulum-based factor for assembly of V-ATPase-domain-containing protein [Xylogone sp. PMI_703]